MLTDSQQCPQCECRKYPLCQRETNDYASLQIHEDLWLQEFASLDFFQKRTKELEEGHKSEAVAIAILLSRTPEPSEDEKKELEAAKLHHFGALEEAQNHRRKAVEQMLALTRKIDKIRHVKQTIPKYQECEFCIPEHRFNERLRDLRHTRRWSPY